MKRTIRLLLLTLSCLLMLAACDEEAPPVQPDPPAAADPAPPKPDPPAPADLTRAEALRLLEEEIDTGDYLILDGSTIATIEDEEYYIFLVANRADNKPVGQIAVSLETGEKFNYEGEDVLSAYAEFALYEPETDPNYDWEGFFTSGTLELELIPMDNTSFEYTIGELVGVARISGNTARDEENDLTMAMAADGTLTLTGRIEGEFSPGTAAHGDSDPEA